LFFRCASMFSFFRSIPGSISPRSRHSDHDELQRPVRILSGAPFQQQASHHYRSVAEPNFTAGIRFLFSHDFFGGPVPRIPPPISLSPGVFSEVFPINLLPEPTLSFSGNCSVCPHGIFFTGDRACAARG